MRVCLCYVFLCSATLSDQTFASSAIRFERDEYVVHVGETFTLNVVLDADASTDSIESLSSGLFSYGYRVTFAPFRAGADAISLPSELDFFAGAEGARSILQPGLVRVKGNVEGDVPYREKSLGNVTLVNTAGVATSYEIAPSIDRDFPTEQVFLDGEGTPFDDDLLFFNAKVTVVRLAGDFDDDGMLLPVDIDLLCEQILGETGNGLFDLNGDGVVNLDDQATWLGIKGVLAGDTDLDGKVAFNDFLVLSSNFAGTGGWADGDFDCSGQILFPDFLLLSSNFGKQTSLPAATVPEPSSLVILSFYFVAMMVWLRLR